MSREKGYQIYDKIAMDQKVIKNWIKGKHRKR